MSTQRAVRDWKVQDRVCPKSLADQGYFVEGTVVRAVPIPDGYMPPASRERHDRLYIVHWPVSSVGPSLATRHGLYLGDDLLSLPEAAETVLSVIEEIRSYASGTTGRNADEERAKRHLVRQAG